MDICAGFCWRGNRRSSDILLRVPAGQIHHNTLAEVETEDSITCQSMHLVFYQPGFWQGCFAPCFCTMAYINYEGHDSLENNCWGPTGVGLSIWTLVLELTRAVGATCNHAFMT